MVTDITSFEKKIVKFFRSYSELLSKFEEISFQENVSERISHPVTCVELVYKVRRMKYAAKIVSSGSKVVKRLRRRKYDRMVIKRTKGLVLDSSTGLFRSIIEHCTLTRQW